MLIATLLLTLLTLIAIPLAILYVKHRVKQAIEDTKNDVREYFLSTDDNGHTLLDNTVLAMSSHIVETISNQLTAKTMAHNSQLSRQANAIQQDMTADYIDNQNPVLGMILDSMPRVKKRLIKNPSAVQVVLPMLDNLMKTGGGPGPNNGGSGNDDWVKKLHGNT